MKIRNQHERIVAAPPERITALLGDFGHIWPTQIAPAPRLLEPGVYKAGIMVWEEFDRPDAAWAFRVARPDELRAEHWSELSVVDGGTLVRHTIEGSAAGKYEAIWRDRIEPQHDLILEAMLDNIEAAVALPGGRHFRSGDPGQAVDQDGERAGAVDGAEPQVVASGRLIEGGQAVHGHPEQVGVGVRVGTG
jgi:hypothetical protein